MKFYIVILAYLFVFSSGCATIVKSDRTPVRFSGGSSNGETRLNLPDGQYNLMNGQTTVLVSRSRQDIPFSVTCNNETREGVIPTRFDALAGVGGNIIFGGIIGLGIDSFGNKTYDPPESFNLSPYCAQPQVQESSKEVEGRKPSSK